MFSEDLSLRQPRVVAAQVMGGGLVIDEDLPAERARRYFFAGGGAQMRSISALSGATFGSPSR